MTSSLPSPAIERLTGELTRRLIDSVARSLGVGSDEVAARAGEAVASLVRDALGELAAGSLRAERLALVGRIAAGVAHELRNPLSVIETSAFIVAERGRADERIARHARRIAEQVAIASGVVSDLLDAARDRPIVGARVDLAAAARAAVAQVPCPSGATVALEVPATGPNALADERRIRQVLTNLIANALDAAGPRGRVVVSARSERHRVVVAVTDNGPGIPVEHLPRLFDPLFTTKAGGTGLGLALSQDIARAHGGEITAANVPGAGARFELVLPAADGPGGAPEGAAGT